MLYVYFLFKLFALTETDQAYLKTLKTNTISRATEFFNNATGWNESAFIKFAEEEVKKLKNSEISRTQAYATMYATALMTSLKLDAFSIDRLGLKEKDPSFYPIRIGNIEFTLKLQPGPSASPADRHLTITALLPNAKDDIVNSLVVVDDFISKAHDAYQSFWKDSKECSLFSFQEGFDWKKLKGLEESMFPAANSSDCDSNMLQDYVKLATARAINDPICQELLLNYAKDDNIGLTLALKIMRPVCYDGKTVQEHNINIQSNKTNMLRNKSQLRNSPIGDRQWQVKAIAVETIINPDQKIINQRPIDKLMGVKPELRSATINVAKTLSTIYMNDKFSARENQENLTFEMMRPLINESTRYFSSISTKPNETIINYRIDFQKIVDDVKKLHPFDYKNKMIEMVVQTVQAAIIHGNTKRDGTKENDTQKILSLFLGKNKKELNEQLEKGESVKKKLDVLLEVDGEPLAFTLEFELKRFENEPPYRGRLYISVLQQKDGKEVPINQIDSRLSDIANVSIPLELPPEEDKDFVSVDCDGCYEGIGSPSKGIEDSTKTIASIIAKFPMESDEDTSGIEEKGYLEKILEFFGI